MNLDFTFTLLCNLLKPVERSIIVLEMYGKIKTEYEKMNWGSGVNIAINNGCGP